MHHVYVIVSRIYGRLFLYLMNSKSDATYTRTYLLMRKQCLMFMLFLAASERAEKNPLKIKFRKDIVESYKPIVWAEPRPISMLQNVSHLSDNHLFLPHKSNDSEINKLRTFLSDGKEAKYCFITSSEFGEEGDNPAKRNFVPAGQKFKFRRNRISFQHEIS